MQHEICNELLNSLYDGFMHWYDKVHIAFIDQFKNCQTINKNEKNI